MMDMILDIDFDKKVQQLKSSFEVEGVPLIKTDRFTREELDEIIAGRKTYGTHSSHWHHLLPNKRIFTDTEVREQLKTMLFQTVIDKQVFKETVARIRTSLPYISKADEKNAFKKALYTLVGWNELTPLDREFWAHFGSAPYTLTKTNNKALIEARNRWGAAGMDEIFGSKFSETYYYCYEIESLINNFDPEWDEKRRLKDLAKQTHRSDYDTLAEMEENETVKHIPEVAKQFYLDKTKPLQERLRVFTKYGKKENFIHQPTNVALKKIFDVSFEDSDNYSRNETIECYDIVSCWLERLKDDRLSLNWSNPYHPKLIKKKRNYKPSEEAMKRLELYYCENLFLEEIGSFDFDW